MSTRAYGAEAFSGGHLERRSDARADPDWPHKWLAAPDTRFIISQGTLHLVRREPQAQIVFVDADHPAVRNADASQLLLLGWYRESACVLVDAVAPIEPPPGTELAELRPLLASLPHEEAVLLACARALLVWRARHRHCGVCGAPTMSHSAGHVLRCTSSECGEEFFPRIDPAIIVLVSDGDQALLGRQASWPAGRYSALAGFVEVGENLEDAVIREVEEETGVHVDQVRYFGSQPWPFPASLMLGFHAHATRGAPRLTGELEDARWFSAAELRAAPAAILPPPHTIARALIERWLADLDLEPGNRRPPPRL